MIVCDAAIHFAERYADLAAEQAARTDEPIRRAELEAMAAICRRFRPARPKRFTRLSNRSGWPIW